MIINVFDCETYKNEKNEVKAYCISYLIKNEITSIFKENKNDDIFLIFFDQIVSKYDKKKIEFYIHNINFDGILILDSVFKNKLKFK
jgi:hypothetical protein